MRARSQSAWPRTREGTRPSIVRELVGGPRTVTSALVNQLRADIIDCALRPGGKLKLSDLQTRYKAGVIPLREALSRLAASGLVEVEDQKGFRVAPVSREDLEDITWVRQQIECLALRQAIERGDVEWETRVIAAHYRLARLSETEAERPGELNPAWERLHRELHAALVSGCGSPWLLNFQRVLTDQTTRYRRLSVAYNVSRDVRGEHQAIVDAALARDATRACTLLTNHFAKTAEIVLAGAESVWRRAGA
jgi:GntR family carbon starvation induced transcriptional regulator